MKTCRASVTFVEFLSLSTKSCILYDHSNETSSALRLHGPVLFFSIFYKMKFRITLEIRFLAFSVGANG